MPKKIRRLGSGEETARERSKVVFELKAKYKLSMLLDIARLNRKTYYYHVKHFEKADKYAAVKERITEIYHANKGRYGYRRIVSELRKEGTIINHKTVERLMKVLGLKCQVRMKKYRSYKGEIGKIAPNLLNRNFEASRPNEKWVTDVTEFNLFGQKLYLSPILDLYDRSIVTYTIYEHPVLNMVTEMVKSAIKKESTKNDLVLHSDQGWHYQHFGYQRLLKENGIRQSMSRKGNCLDNSVMENFFGHLKSELLYLQKFDSIEHFKSELIAYIDWYNNKRTKAKFGYISPLEYRHQAA
ncbi:MAG: IS3 family transposase [Ruminococcus sp.]|nr:IS3 family transposase [Ruminococcus sp.]